jgi:hypothetical protein
MIEKTYIKIDKKSLKDLKKHPCFKGLKKIHSQLEKYHEGKISEDKLYKFLDNHPEEVRDMQKIVEDFAEKSAKVDEKFHKFKSLFQDVSIKTINMIEKDLENYNYSQKCQIIAMMTVILLETITEGSPLTPESLFTAIRTLIRTDMPLLAREFYKDVE